MAESRSRAAPRVTVMLTVFNCARYLPDALDGILSQTMRDFEVVAVDDGSTDDTAELLDRCAKTDGRVRVLRQANRGIAAARNAAIRLVRRWTDEIPDDILHFLASRRKEKTEIAEAVLT